MIVTESNFLILRRESIKKNHLLQMLNAPETLLFHKDTVRFNLKNVYKVHDIVPSV